MVPHRRKNMDTGKPKRFMEGTSVGEFKENAGGNHALATRSVTPKVKPEVAVGRHLLTGRGVKLILEAGQIPRRSNFVDCSG